MLKSLRQEDDSTPRQKRFVPVGIPVHATNRGNDRRRLFFKAADYEAVVAILAKSAEKLPIDLDAYNVMPNHLHLVLRQKEPGAVSAYLHRVLGGISRHHRRRTGTVGMGHVFQSRFWSQLLGRDRDYLAAMRYVEGNAHRAGLVARAEDWRWGSLWERVTHERTLLAPPFVMLPTEWVELVNEGQIAGVLAELRKRDRRGRPRRSPGGR